MATKNLIEVIIRAKNETSAGFASVSKSLQGLGDNISKVGLGLTAGVTAPLTAAGLVAVSSASDMEESLSKVNVVFGDMSDSVYEFSRTAAKSLGISQQSALEATGTFGNLFTAMGLSQKESADMSTELVALASDLASFNNLNPEDVLIKLRAGLTGETEPLKTLGVNLSAAAVEARAMAMGLITSKDELDAAAKAQATYSLILEQTTNAQGDFARTSEGLANSTRVVKAQMSDVTAELGAMLLPVALKIVTAIKDIISNFTALSPEMKKAIVVIGGIAAAIGPVLLVVGKLITAISAIGPVIGAIAGVMSGPILLVIGVIVAAIAGLALAWKNNWFDIQGKTKQVIDTIKDIIADFVQIASDWWSKYGDDVVAVAKWMWDGVKQIVETVVEIVGAIIKRATEIWQSFWSEHGDSITSILQRAWDSVRAIFEAFATIFGELFAAFRSAIEGDWTAFGEHLRNAFDAAWQAIITVINNAWLALQDLMGIIITSIVKFVVNTDWRAVGNSIIEGIAQGIRNGVPMIINAAKSAAKAALDAAKGFLGIKSPSDVFSKQVGAPSAEGFAEGFAKTIGSMASGVSNSLGSLISSPQLATAGAINSAPVVSSGYGGGSTGSVSVNINYAPFISTASESEATQVLAPIIENVIRRDKLRG